jgi:hypothetical protein
MAAQGEHFSASSARFFTYGSNPFVVVRLIVPLPSKSGRKPNQGGRGLAYGDGFGEEEEGDANHLVRISSSVQPSSASTFQVLPLLSLSPSLSLSLSPRS